MINYDQLEGFIEYSNQDYWKKYIENFVIPLWRDTLQIIQYSNQIKSEFDNASLKDISNEDKRLLLGGINPEIDVLYTSNSLAKFYFIVFGLSLEDLKSWVNSQYYEIESFNDKIQVTDTEFITYIKEIYNILEDGLTNQHVVEYPSEPVINYSEIKKDPIKTRDLLKDFYQSLLNIILNYNYGTFFLCSINQLTYKWMNTAYPKIKEILQFLKNQFGLKKLMWENPIDPESDLYEDYSIYCFPDYDPQNPGKSFGGAICKLIEFVFSSDSTGFNDILDELFGNILNFKEKYKEEIATELPEKRNKSIFFKGLMASDYSGGIKDSNKTLMEMLDEIMPYIFTNILKFTHYDDDRILFSEI